MFKDLNLKFKDADLNSEELQIFFQTSETALLRLNEPAPGVFIAESAKVIERALDAGYEALQVLAASDQINDEVKSALARLAGSDIYISDSTSLKKIRGFHLTNGIMCVMKRRMMRTPAEVCCGKRRIAVLEDVENPTNVGAIFRSAAALGIEAVLLTKGCADPLYRRAARVSMGCVFSIEWTYIDADDYINILKEMGFASAAMALCEESVSISEESLKKEKKLAIILGNEGAGLREDTIEKSDYTVMIPMHHQVDSLNVAAASAVAFWELSKQNG